MHFLATFFAGIFLSLESFFGIQTDAPIVAPEPAASSTQAEHASAQGQSSAQAHAAVQSPVASSPTAGSVALTGSSWLSAIPLGDGKYSTSGPKKGYVYLCHIATGGGGAQGKASWISGDTWYPAQKVAVQGAVEWPSATYRMKLSGSSRVVTANGLPTDHTTGTFPIQRTDPAYQYDANPNSISAQSYSFSLPATPTQLASPQCIYGQVGIMNDGVPLFDGFDAEYRDAVAHETQDADEGHPEKQGAYHYHGFEIGPVKESVSTVVGFAFDGFPITGSKLSDGTYLHTADLDECHGTTGTVMLDGTKKEMYHYVLTQDFPYSVSCFRGKSYEPKPGRGVSAQAGVQAGAQGGTPPQEAIAACAGKASDASCSFQTPNGTVSGTCRATPDDTVACVPVR